MIVDFIIKNGHVIDSSMGIDEIKDIAIKNNKIVDISCSDTCPEEHVIDAAGCIVTPGLVDFHAHVFWNGSGICIHPDLLAAQGTTTVVDAGSAGTSNYAAFCQTIAENSVLRIKSFLTVFSGGQLDSNINEDFNPELWNVPRMERMIDKYRNRTLGLKIRISKGLVADDKAVDYLKSTVELAEKLSDKLDMKLKVCVHTTNSPVPAGKLADCLRKGDIFCHCFHGMNNNIIAENGEIDRLVLEARKRGVIFDAANGKGNFGIETAKAALKKGFQPDIISSDLSIEKFNIPPYDKNLPTVLSKYVDLGMNLFDIIKAATATPAFVMGEENNIGTLKAGAYADIAVFKMKNVDITHKDWKNDVLHGHTLLVPQMTFCAGDIQFCQTDFWI